MKTIVYFLLCTLLLCTLNSVAQNQLEYYDIAELDEGTKINESSSTADNGFQFSTFTTGINTKYADYGVGFYKEKFISYSARKIGSIAKKDPNTGEPYTKLYCSDITYEYDLRKPHLFSNILNRNNNLGTISFTKDGETIYFTQSKKGDSQSFNLYSATMNPNREGEWIDITPISAINGNYSVENPHISKDEKWLYFSSNKSEAIGGYDIFRIAIKNNKPSGEIERIEGSVNTALDEKFPQTSFDGRYLYFSSKGHDSQGGFDVFRSRECDLGFVATKNLGSSINSTKDDIAYIQATKTVGFLTSNRAGGKGNYDIYKAIETPLDLSIAGRVFDKDTQMRVPNATVVLIDDNGEEVATMQSDQDGLYLFPVDAFLDYTVIAYKDGFKSAEASVNTSSNTDKTYMKNLTLQSMSDEIAAILKEATPAEIVVSDEKTIIKIDNIQFDYGSSTIKDISINTLNTVVATLYQNPDIKIFIKAHTDANGSASFNKSLSEQRAGSVMNYLLSKKISQDRMMSKGFGEEELLIECTSCTKTQNKLNRRVEFVVITE